MLAITENPYRHRYLVGAAKKGPRTFRQGKGFGSASVWKTEKRKLICEKDTLTRTGALDGSVAFSER